ncbi:MAG: ACT domain-containing protein [Smithellaceae bacterium]|nr:ACT domain-containing protein [Smithellaceae bacterium]
MGRIKIGGVMQSDGRSMIRLTARPEQPGSAGGVMGLLGGLGINIEFLVASCGPDDCSHLTMCVDGRDLEATLAGLDEAKERLGLENISCQPEVVVMSIYGPHFREKPRIAGVMFSALARAGVKVSAVSTSISSISCVIRAEDRAAVLQVLGDSFDIPQHIKNRPKDY